MDFFSKLGNMASETYKKTSKKTGNESVISLAARYNR